MYFNNFQRIINCCRLSFILSNMYCSDRADVHRIYIFFSNKFRNIFYIVLLLFFRNDRCDNACKSTTVNTAYACANLLEEKLCQLSSFQSKNTVSEDRRDDRRRSDRGKSSWIFYQGKSYGRNCQPG